MIERGFDVEVTAWYGLFGPRGMAAPLVQSLNAHMNAVLQMPDVNERMNGLGIPRRGGDVASFADVVRADSERYGRLVREFNISA